MAAEEAIAAGVFELRADADQFVSAVANAQQTAERFERATVAAFTRAGKSSGELGNADIRSWVRETERLITANERQAASAALSGSALQQLKAQGRGISEEIYVPLVAALKGSEENLLALKRAAEQARNIHAFDTLLADSEKLGQVSKNIDSITAALDRLEGEERQAGQTRVFDSRVAEAAKLGLAEQYMRRYQDAAGDLAVAERAFAADAAFVQGLKRRSDAIGKTQADLLELEAAERGVSAQAAPMIARLREQERALGIYSGGARDARVSTNQLRTAMAQLPAQFTDVFTSLAGGQNPLLVLIQQGGQIKDSFGGIGPALRAVGGAIAAAFTPATVLIGGALATVAAFTAGVVAGEREMSGYRQALVLTGNAAGTTAGQLQATAEAVSRTVGTQGKAAEAIAALAATGRVAGRDLGLLAEAAIRLEREGGPAVKDTVAAFAELGKNPTQGALKLNETTRFLTVSVLEQIRALEEQGKVTEAARVAQEAYATASIDRTKELASQLGTLERAWRGVADWAKSAWDAVLNVGRGNETDKAIDDMVQKLNRLRGVQNNTAIGNLGEFVRSLTGTSIEQQANEAQSVLVKLLEGKQARENLAAQQAAAGALTGEYNKAADAVKKWGDASLTATQKAQKAIEEYRREVETYNKGQRQRGVAELTPAQIAKAEQAIRDSFKESGGRVKAQSTLMEELSGLTTTYARDLAELQSIRAKGLVSEERYIELVTELIQKQPFARELTKQQADADKARAKALGEITAASIKAADAQARNEMSAEAEVKRLRDQYEALYLSKEAIEEKAAARLEESAAAYEQAAADALADGGLSQAEIDSYRRTAQALREQAALRRAVASGTAQKEAEEANAKAAENALREWQRTSDQIGQSLADALMEGGKSAGEYLKGLFRSMVLRPIIQGIVQPVAGAVTSFLGVAGGAAGAGGGALGSAMQGASLANNIYQAYNGGGLAGSALAAGNYATVASGSAYGTGFASQQSMALAAQEAGMVSQAGAGAMSSWAGYAGWIGAAIAAAIQGSADWSAGWRREQARDSGTVLGEASFRTADLFSRLGVSDRIADLISGATLTARAFGRRAPTVEAQGVTGTLSGGDFTGQAYADMVEKGGWFRSDKRYTEFAEASTQLDQFISDAAKSVMSQAKNYGEALGLPVEALGSVSTDIKIALTDDAAKNQEALGAALASYGDALVAGYAEAIKPLVAYGETTAETLERVGTAMAGVNDVLDTLGLTALQASIAGGEAAVSLQDLFGGLSNLQQASGTYLQAYYSEAERTALSTKAITGALADFGLQLPASREAFRSLVEAQDLTTQAGRESFTALMGVAGAFAQITPSVEDLAEAQKAAADAAAQAAEKIRQMAEQIASGLDAVIGDFIGGDELATFRASRIASTLRGGGIEASTEGVLGSTREDIVALWRQVGDEGKEAILKAYSAWKTLKQGIADDLQGQIDAITTKYGDLSVIDEPVETLSEAFVRNREELRALEEGLNNLVGNVGKTVQETLADMLASQRALAEYRTSLSDAIADANLRSLTPGARVDALRAQEATLFAQVGSAADPVAAAQRLQGVIVARIKEEVALRQQAAEAESALVRDARERQMDALRDQISAAERLSDLAKDIAQFTASTRFSELSPLSARDQLAAARTLFDTTLAAAPTDENAQRNLLTNAQAYLQELASFAPVGTEQYANEFARVMGALDELGLSGADSNPVVSALQDQLAVLEAVNDSQALQEALARESAAMEAAAFTQMQSVLGSVKEAQDRAIEAQLKVAQEEIAQRDKILKNQEAQITQQAAIVKELTDTMKELWAETTEDRIAGSQPTSGFVGGVRER